MAFVPSSRFCIENQDQDFNELPPPHERRGEFWSRVSGLLGLTRPETTDEVRKRLGVEDNETAGGDVTSYGTDGADADLLAMRRRESRIAEMNGPKPPTPLQAIVGDTVHLAKEAVKTATEAISRRGWKLTAAINWLGKVLKRDFLTEKEVRDLAEKEGYNFRTIIRAKQKLGVKSEKKNYGRRGYWIWKLPPRPGKESSD